MKETSKYTSPMNRPGERHYHTADEIRNSSNSIDMQEIREIGLRYPMLTAVQLQVCALVRENLSNAAIAKRLNIAEKTVENHLRRSRIAIGCPPGTDLAVLLQKK